MAQSDLSDLSVHQHPSIRNQSDPSDLSVQEDHPRDRWDPWRQWGLWDLWDLWDRCR